MFGRENIEKFLQSGNYSKALDALVLLKNIKNTSLKIDDVGDYVKQIVPLALAAKDIDCAALAAGQLVYFSHLNYLWDDILQLYLVERGHPRIKTDLDKEFEPNRRENETSSEWISRRLNRIIKQMQTNPGLFSKIERIPVRLTKTSLSYAPSELASAAEKIWGYFSKNDWSIPGYTVKFDGSSRYGSASCHVNEIRGKNFILFFNERDHERDVCGGFNQVITPFGRIQYHSDGSMGIYQYVGTNIEEILPSLKKYSSYEKSKQWKKIQVMSANQVCLEHLFDPKKNSEFSSAQRLSKDELELQTLKFLEKEFFYVVLQDAADMSEETIFQNNCAHFFELPTVTSLSIDAILSEAVTHISKPVHAFNLLHLHPECREQLIQLFLNTKLPITIIEKYYHAVDLVNYFPELYFMVTQYILEPEHFSKLITNLHDAYYLATQFPQEKQAIFATIVSNKLFHIFFIDINDIETAKSYFSEYSETLFELVTLTYSNKFLKDLDGFKSVLKIFPEYCERLYVFATQYKNLSKFLKYHSDLKFFKATFPESKIFGMPDLVSSRECAITFEEKIRHSSHQFFTHGAVHGLLSNTTLNYDCTKNIASFLDRSTAGRIVQTCKAAFECAVSFETDHNDTTELNY